MREHFFILFFILFLAGVQPACTNKESMRIAGSASIDNGNGKGFAGDKEDPSETKALVKLGNAKIRCETLKSSLLCNLYVTNTAGMEILAVGFEDGVSVSFSLSGNAQILAQALSCEIKNAGLSYVCNFDETTIPPNVILGVGVEVSDSHTTQTEQSNTTAVLNRAHDSWRTMSPVPASFVLSGAKLNAKAVWTGSEMVIWGGYSGAGQDNPYGASYDPVTDTWKALSTVSPPQTRRLHGMVWTGKVVVIWGGAYGYIPADGGIYDPVLDKWTPTSMTNVPIPVYGNAFVWTGSKVITFGGACADCGPGGSSVAVNTGAQFDPEINQWTPMSTLGAPSPVAYTNNFNPNFYIANKMVVFGGMANGAVRGGVFDSNLGPGGTWSQMDLTNHPAEDGSAVSTGDKLFVFGGNPGNTTTPLNTAGLYDPIQNKWEVLTTTGAPSPRTYASVVYDSVGKRVIVFGGVKGYSAFNGMDVTFNDGGIFDLNSKTWKLLSKLNTPSARVMHNAVWTGSEMLIFGGASIFSEDETPLNNGAAYYP